MFRYSVGDAPYFVLKQLIKWLIVAKQSSSAISCKVISVVTSRVAALSSLTLFIYCFGVMPVVALKILRKCFSQ